MANLFNIDSRIILYLKIFLLMFKLFLYYLALRIDRVSTLLYLGQIFMSFNMQMKQRGTSSLFC